MEICVRFATNRRPIGSPITGFSSDLSSHEGTDLRYGSVRVKVDGGKARYVKGSLSVADEQLYVKNNQDTFKLGSVAVSDSFRNDMKQSDALGVIHGYFNSFEASIEGAAGALINANALEFPLFTFAWPSKDKLLGYHPDRRTARRKSGEALARAVEKFFEYVQDLSRREYCNHELNLLAHSMGNYVLRAGLQEIRRRRPELLERQLFSDVILVAADEDADALEHEDKLQLICRMARRVTVYHTDRDGALWASDNLKFNPDRLGRRGPNRISATPDNVFAVDVSAVIDADASNKFHSYYRTIPAVGSDIKALLSNTPTYDITNRLVSREHQRKFKLVQTTPTV